MNRRRLLARLLAGQHKNVSFARFQDLAEGFGFKLVRISGSHHIFSHPTVEEILNIQPIRGEMKPYQVRQFLRLVEAYNLRLGDNGA